MSSLSQFQHEIISLQSSFNVHKQFAFFTLFNGKQNVPLPSLPLPIIGTLVFIYYLNILDYSYPQHLLDEKNKSEGICFQQSDISCNDIFVDTHLLH